MPPLPPFGRVAGRVGRTYGVVLRVVLRVVVRGVVVGLMVVVRLVVLGLLPKNPPPPKLPDPNTLEKLDPPYIKLFLIFWAIFPKVFLLNKELFLKIQTCLLKKLLWAGFLVEQA